MPGLASNAEAAKSWNLAKKCLAAGDVHAGYAAFSTAKRLLDEQVQTHVNQPQSKYLWRATSIEAKTEIETPYLNDWEKEIDPPSSKSLYRFIKKNIRIRIKARFTKLRYISSFPEVIN